MEIFFSLSTWFFCRNYVASRDKLIREHKKAHLHRRFFDPKANYASYSKSKEPGWLLFFFLTKKSSLFFQALGPFTSKYLIVLAWSEQCQLGGIVTAAGEKGKKGKKEKKTRLETKRDCEIGRTRKKSGRAWNIAKNKAVQIARKRWVAACIQSTLESTRLHMILLLLSLGLFIMPSFWHGFTNCVIRSLQSGLVRSSTRLEVWLAIN